MNRKLQIKLNHTRQITNLVIEQATTKKRSDQMTTPKKEK